MTRSRFIYVLAFPVVAFALCVLSYFMGYNRGKQAATVSARTAVENLVPADHESSGELTFFKTLRDQKPPAEGAVAPRRTPSPEAKPLRLASAEESSSGSFGVQISAFKDIGKAHELVDDLKTRGHSAYVVSGKTKGKEWHRVYVGPFPSKEKAQAALQELEKDGFHNGFVTTVETGTR
ncbi:MAG: SPOR domain-containing protein [Pseudomonadota bacterium]